MRRKILDPAVGGRLTHIRHKAGLTQEALARKWKVSQTCIKTFEGGRVPHATFLLEYAGLGDVTTDWLLTGESDSRLIDRRIRALRPQQHTLILEVVDMLGSGSKGLENRFRSVLELLEAARDNLDKDGRG